MEKADQKYQKINEIEKNLKYAKNNNQRLRVEYEAMKQHLAQCQKQVEIHTQENQILKNKLDSLWEKYEEEKDVVMLVTKSEVEKSKQEEITLLQERLNSLESQNKDLNERMSQYNTL